MNILRNLLNAIYSVPVNKIHKPRSQHQRNLRYFDAILHKIKKKENLNLVSQFLLVVERAYVLAFFTLLTYFEGKSYRNLTFENIMQIRKWLKIEQIQQGTNLQL